MSAVPGSHESPGAIEGRLARLGVELPAPGPPAGNFTGSVQAGELLFVSGQIPSWNGELRYLGSVGGQVTVDQARAAARLCALNALAQAQAALGTLDRVRRVCQVQGFVNAVAGFGDHPAVLNGASDLLVEIFGEAGRHTRFAVGAGSLPFNVPVEVALVMQVRSAEASPGRPATG